MARRISQKKPVGVSLHKALFVFALFYLTFHTFHGDRGFLALLSSKHQLVEIDKKMAVIAVDRQVLEARVRGLRYASLNLDLLDEQARNMLGLVGKNELVIVWPVIGR
jgi:cell division protein FtsB